MNYSNFLYRLFNPKRMRAIDLAVKVQYYDKQKLDAVTNDKFMQLILHARANVPYYAEILKDIDIKSVDDIHKIPFLTKDIIRENLENLKAKNYAPENIKGNSTSGSTGVNLKFFSDATDFYSGACQVRGDMANDYVFGNKYISLWGASRDLDKSWKKKITARLLRRRIILSSFKMSEEGVKKYIRIINKFKPKLIIGYPSGLFLMSEYIIKNNIRIHSPGTIISGGETLFDFHVSSIQKAFRTKVLNRYGCREVDHIAGECPQQNGLHISTDHVVVEVVDENGRICNPGEQGEIVVTDLDNLAFPFIRYKIGDIGVMSDRICSCGRGLPMLEKVEGRVFDIVIGTNNNRVTGNYWTLLRNEIKGIKQIQVIQEVKGAIILNIVKGDEFTEEENKKLFKEIKDRLGEDLNIDLKLVDHIPLTDSGKLRWVVSKVSPYVN